MSKQLFRFLRGELLNSFYINNLQNVMNIVSEDIKQFFIYMRSLQFNLTDMSSTNIYNIGKFAGVFLPILNVGEGYGASRLAESEIIDGVERSERGLFSASTESFNFVHAEQDEYVTDINTLATSNNRSSLVGEDDTTVGYIDSTDTDVLDNNGIVKPSSILSTPPLGVAYSNYYGSTFLYLAEILDETRSIDISIYYDLFLVMQKIRYNGESIKSLCDVIASLCPNELVLIDRIERYTAIDNVVLFNLYYYFNINSNTTYKTQRIATLKYVIATKFQQVTLEEILV